MFLRSSLRAFDRYPMEHSPIVPEKKSHTLADLPVQIWLVDQERLAPGEPSIRRLREW